MSPSLFFYSLVSITIRGGGEIDLHDGLELCVVAAVLEVRVVVVTAEHVGLIVRKTRAMKSKVVSAFVVSVWFTHSEMSGEGCS